MYDDNNNNHKNTNKNNKITKQNKKIKSELNAINRMEAINTLATPLVTYSFNIVDWKMEEVRKLDRKPENYSPWKGCTTQEQTWIECTSQEIRAVGA